MNIFRKFLAGAAIAMSVLSINTAAAQTKPDQFGITYQAPAAQQTFEQPALGLALKPEEAAFLVTNDCFVGPWGTTRELYDKAKKEKARPCSKKFYSFVDDYVGKESTVSFVVARVGDGYLHCSLRKITNLGDNRDGCALYPFNPAFNNAGQVGKYADVSRTEGGDTMKGKVLGAIVAGTVNNLTGAFATQGAQKLFGTYCGANGGCGDKGSIFNVSASAAGGAGGNAAAGAIATSEANLTTTGDGACLAGGPCPAGGQVLNPNPGH